MPLTPELGMGVMVMPWLWRGGHVIPGKGKSSLWNSVNRGSRAPACAEAHRSLRLGLTWCWPAWAEAGCASVPGPGAGWPLQGKR